mgnify:CR=1 FL=1
MKYQYWLSNIPGVGCKTIHRLLGQAGSAEEIYFLKKEQLEKLSGLSDRQVHAITERKKSWDLEEKYAALGESGISFLSCEMESYPRQLKNIVDAPYSLYIKGKMPDFSKRRVAVVGARMCSEYGRAMAEQIGEKLALCGAEVLSGMARGIDAYGHIGALKAGGNTYAVLGCGVNICYPRTNQKLYENILSHGGIISEYPPETEPIAQLFPARNRIISALSDVVVIVEAKERSGSLITADFALEQGKDIYALPGPINSQLSRGCNSLIKQGAGILLSPEEFLEELSFVCEEKMKKLEENKIALESPENLVYSCLDLYPKNLNELADITDMKIATLMNVLVSLELQGYVREISKNHYIRLK